MIVNSKNDAEYGEFMYWIRFYEEYEKYLS